MRLNRVSRVKRTTRRRNRRGGGGSAAPINPATLSPLVWYDPSDVATVTQAGGLVSQINDKSGNGHHQVQATGANQPGWGNTLNGLNVLGGGANVSQWMQASGSALSAFNALHNGTKVLVVGVFNTGAFGANANGWFGTGDRDTAGNGIAVQSETGPVWRFDAKAGASFQTFDQESVASLGLAFGTTGIISMLLDLSNGTTTARVKWVANAGALQGSNASATAISATDAAAQLYIMRTLSGNACAADARFGEFVIVTGANATDANRLGLLAYLNAKWAVY